MTTNNVYNNDGTSAAGWFRSTTGGTGASLNTTNESGYLTWNPGANVNNMHMLAYFTNSTLNVINDSIKLTVSYKMTGITTTNGNNYRLRVGLYSSGGFQVGDNHGAGNAAFTNYNGYFGIYAAPSGQTSVQMHQKLQASTNLLVAAVNSPNSELLGSSTKSAAMTDNTAYTLTLTITRTNSGNVITFSQTGGANWSFTTNHTGGTQAPFYDFDTIAFGVLDGGTSVLDDWRFNSIKVDYTSAQGGTATTLVSSQSPARSGEPVYFTATVTPNPGSGTVQFKTNGVNFGSAVALSGGQAISPTVSNLPRGSNLVSAVYSGTVNYLASSNSITQMNVASNAPNFIFIITDDQRWDAVGVVQRELAAVGQARFSWFTNQTPGMDRLAREGVRFRNAFVTTSVCSVSRAEFLTGKYPHITGVVDNGDQLPANTVSYASTLQSQGYQTLYAGKWHMGGQTNRPGFAQFASFVDQGHYFDETNLLVNGVRQPSTGTNWIDDVTTDYALNYLSNNAAAPFALVVGFKSPHDPRTPRADLDNLYTAQPILPAVNATNYVAPYVASPGGPSDANILQYLECLKGVDQNVERILNTLDGLNLFSNTMVIYTSDNGYFFKEHGLGDKRAAYEESLRIPFIVRYPPLGLTNVVRDEQVLNIDLAPTFLDFADVSIPAGMQGRSWRSLLEDASPPAWRTNWIYEYTRDMGVPLVPTTVAMRSPTTKLILYPTNAAWAELFDLSADPFETNNLAFNPANQALYASAYQDMKAQLIAIDYLPRILNPSLPGNTAAFKVKAGYGMCYRVEKSSDLVNWTTLSSSNYVDKAAQLTNTFTDPNATNTKALYRVRLRERN